MSSEFKLVSALVGFVAFVVLMISSFYVVPPGHVGVTVLGGKVTGQIDDGWGFMNPLADVVEFDCREKSELFDKIEIRSRDQLVTKFDISVQYRALASSASESYRNTGDVEALVETHLKPGFRKVSRMAGRNVQDSKDFSTSETQNSLILEMEENISAFLEGKGLAVSAVLVRDIIPPPVIEAAIERTAEREQQTQHEQAELDRFRIEQEKLVASAKAELEASQLEAQQIVALAQARADSQLAVATAEAKALELQGAALAANPDILKLRALERWKGEVPKMITGESMQMLVPVPNLDK